MIFAVETSSKYYRMKMRMVIKLRAPGNLTSFLYEMISGVRYTSVGASGAIYGIMGAVVLLALKRRSGLNVTGRRLFIAVAYCIYSSFAMPGIDYAAHIGGLVSGFLMSTLLLR